MRCIGRAPINGSNPCLAKWARNAVLKVASTFFSCNCSSNCIKNLSTTRMMIVSSSALKETIASKRLRNSGVKNFLISAISSPDSRTFVKPIMDFCIASAPALVVMMMMTLRKSVLRPLLSVKVPWSITCKRILKISGWAFSTSSNKRTQCGFLLTASVSKPPWSNPTYPGGAPIKRLTAWRSIYSDISKRSSSMPKM